MNYYEVLKALKGLPVTDYRTMLFARKIRKNYTKDVTVSGVPCVLEKSVGKPIISYKIYGNTVQNGTPTPESSVDVQGCGDRTANLLDISKVSHLGIYNDSGAVGTINSRLFSNFIRVKNHYNINFNIVGVSSKNEDIYVNRIIIYDQNKNFVRCFLPDQLAQSNKNMVFIVPDDAYYVVVDFRTLDLTTPLTPSDIEKSILTFDSEPTQYVPYGCEIPVVVRSENHEPITTPIYLPEPLYKGDYIIKDKSGGKVHREWGVKVFDGTENVSYESGRDRFYTDIIGLKIANEPRLIRMYSNFYTCLYNNEPFDDDFDKVIYKGGSINYIYIHDKRFTTTNDFKSFLASEYAKGTPVTIYYPLETPTEEPIELPEIPTFDGTTIIETDTQMQPENIEITYKSRR